MNPTNQSKPIHIEKTTISVPTKIEVDGVDYPITQYNIDIVRQYWVSGDEKILEKLSNVSLVF